DTSCNLVNTALVLTADDRLRAQFTRSLAGFSVFDARSDSDALRMLRLVDIDIIMRDSAGPAGALAALVGSGRDIAPHALIVAVGAGGDDNGADFTVPEGFTPRELEAVLRHALERQRLIREIAAMRTTLPAATPPSSSAYEPWDGAAVARVLRGFTGVL